VAAELRCDSGRGRRYAARVRADALALMRILGLQDWELSIVLVGDRAMRRLNRRFRHKDRSTDVLSFAQLDGGRSGAGALRARAQSPRLAGKAAPARAGAQPVPMLGDVVISVDTALAQARRGRIAPAARLRALLLHGLLHLLGYDHERSAGEARRMSARERQLAAKLASTGRGARIARAPAAASPRAHR
jgi:probable rRNA maturation factor